MILVKFEGTRMGLREVLLPSMNDSAPAKRGGESHVQIGPEGLAHIGDNETKRLSIGPARARSFFRYMYRVGPETRACVVGAIGPLTVDKRNRCNTEWHIRVI